MKYLAFAMTLGVAITSYAQEPTPVQTSLVKKCYMETSFGFASHNGSVFSMGLRSVLQSNWTASISYYSIGVDPHNTPHDFDEGYWSLLGLSGPDKSVPRCKINFTNVTGGKLIELGKKTWATAEAGISFGNGEKQTFTPQRVVTGAWYQTSNYKVETHKQNFVGGLLRADLNWACLRWMGLGFGGFYNCNPVQAEAGFEFRFMFGLLNPKK